MFWAASGFTNVDLLSLTLFPYPCFSSLWYSSTEKLCTSTVIGFSCSQLVRLPYLFAVKQGPDYPTIGRHPYQAAQIGFIWYTTIQSDTWLPYACIFRLIHPWTIRLIHTAPGRGTGSTSPCHTQTFCTKPPACLLASPTLTFCLVTVCSDLGSHIYRLITKPSPMLSIVLSPHLPMPMKFIKTGL